MANSVEELTALLFGDNTQKVIASENPYYQFASVPQAVQKSAMQMMQPSGYDENGDLVVPASRSEALPWAVGSGLLQGVLEGLGSDYQNTLTDRYTNVASGAEAGGYLPDALFGSAKRQGKLFNQLNAIEEKQNQRERSNKFQDKLLDLGMMLKEGKDGKVALVKIPGLDINSQAAEKKAAETTASLEATDLYMSGQSGKGLDVSVKGVGDKQVNPLTAKGKVITDIEDASRGALKGSPAVSNFGDVKTNFETLKDLYQFDDRAATLAFISSFARVLDPASVVREGEIKNAENTQSFLSGLGYKLDSLVSGKQQLDPAVKQGMIRAAGAKYNNFGTAYQRLLENEKELVSRRGANSENIFGPYEYKPFNFAEWYKSPGREQKTVLQEVAGDSLETILGTIAAKVQGGQALSAEEMQVVAEAKRSRGMKPGASGSW